MKNQAESLARLKANGLSENTLKNWRKYGLITDDDDLNARVELLVPRPRKAPKSGAPKAISLFSGCGGMDLGLLQAGFEISYANDLDLNAANTYSRNIGAIDPRTIYDVDETIIGRADLLTAGFPCQPFSNAGLRKGTSDPRGTLFWETLRFLESATPKVVIFENVRGLLSMRNPDGELLIDAIVEELNQRGYRTSFKLLNAARFGVPQNRFRVVIVGIKGKSKTFNWEQLQASSADSIGEVLKGIRGGMPNSENCLELSPQARKLVVHIPEGGSWKSVPRRHLPDRLKKIQDNMERYHSPNFYRRFARHEVMGTVTATSSPENSGILHPIENRRYSVREIARFQSFPDDFIFYGTSVSSMYRQIGNAVPPLLAKVIADSLFKQNIL